MRRVLPPVHSLARVTTRGAARLTAVVVVGFAAAFSVVGRGAIGAALAGSWHRTRSPAAVTAVAADTPPVYGPRQFSTPTGTSTYHVESFTVTIQPGKLYTLEVDNGAPDGSARVSGGWVVLNGDTILKSADLGSGAAQWTRAIEALTQDTIQVTVQGSAGAYVTASVLSARDPTFLVFGPDSFPRLTGQPTPDTDYFSISATAAAPYRMCVVNGNADGTHRLASATIVLNGVTVLSSSDLNQNVASLMRTVTLQPNDTLIVTVASTPGGFLLVCFRATDVTPPTITITQPANNFITRANQVTVSGSVQDETATTVAVNGAPASMNGTTFSATVALTTEGNNVIHVVATDGAGLSTDSSRTVIHDTQPPVLTVNSPADRLITNQKTVTVAGTVTDLTAVTVNVNGIPLPVDGSGVFTGTITLAEGANVLTVTATDAAGNATSVVRIVTLDTTPPVLTVTQPADGSSVTTTSVTLAGTVSDDTQVTLTANGVSVPVNADGSFTASVPLALGSNTITVVAKDAATNSTTVTRTVIRNSPLPPDPATVASAVNRAEITTIGTATSFLYSGTTPIQTGVAAGTISPVRAAVVRGRVLDHTLQPLSGATVTILNHAELGQTLSRADGGYDLAVNGGGAVTLNFAKGGYFPAQRTVSAAWQDYTTLSDVILLQPDTLVTVVNLAASSPGVARASVVSDADGSRRATLIFKPGMQATLTRADGTQQSLTTLSVRATEYTVGDSGKLSMPAPLPPASQYTYAVQLSADEQLAAGPGAQLGFNQPVPLYVDNFLHVPGGTPVPTGGYDATKGTWVAQPNGIALRVLGKDSTGRALVDINGDGVADPPSALATLGIDDYELLQLGNTYPAGSDLWRALAPVFEPEDLNFPWIFVGAPPTDGKVKAGCSSREGDPVRCQIQAQTAHQAVGVTGSLFTMHYASDRTQGNAADRKLDITLTGPTLQAQLKRVELEVDVAGQRFRGAFTPVPNLTYSFNWDGKDIYGRLVQGTQPATVLIGYVFPVEYAAPANATDAFGLPCAPSGTGSVCTVISNPVTGARAERTLVQAFQTSIGILDATALGLGGFTLDVQHVYDPVGQVLYDGDGTRRATAGLPPGIRTIGGVGGLQGPFEAAPENVPATQEELRPSFVAMGPDGTVYFEDRAFLIRKITPDGLVHNILGSPATYSGLPSGDNGPASQATAGNIQSLALGPDGSIYFGDLQSIRRIAPNGIVTTVAGTGTASFSGDGGPATAATFFNPGGIDVGPDGSLYIADHGNLRVRRVGPDGIITTVAGNGTFCNPNLSDADFNTQCGNGIAAKQAALADPRDVKVGPDGSFYLSEPGLNRVRRIGPDGIIRTFAGSANVQTLGDGGPATLAALVGAWALAISRDGSVYISQLPPGTDQPLFRIRRVASTGIITTAVGTGVWIGNAERQGWAGDGGPAGAAQIGQVRGMAVGPDGNLALTDNYRIRKVSGFLPGLGAGQTVIASADGRQLYVFSNAGRQLFTLDALSGDTLIQYSYNASLQVVAIVDRNHQVTQVVRDASGRATALIAPNGRRTDLVLDAAGNIAAVNGPDDTLHYNFATNGLLSSYTDAAGSPVNHTYDANGLLTGATDSVGGLTVTTTPTTNGSQTTVTTQSGRFAVLQSVNLANGGTQQTGTMPDGGVVTSTAQPDGSTSTQLGTGDVLTTSTRGDPRFGGQAPLLDLTETTPSGLVRARHLRRTTVLSDTLNPGSPIIRSTDSLVFNARVAAQTFDRTTMRVTSVTPAGRQFVMRLDSAGRVRSKTAAGVDSITYAYDSAGRPTLIAQGVRFTRTSFNTDGKPDSMSDAVGRTVRYAYAGGRLVTSVDPGGDTTRLAYDANGNLTAITPPGRPAHLLTYGAGHRLATYTAPSVGSGSTTTTMTYDVDGRLTGIQRPSGAQIQYAFDPGGRRTTTTIPDGVYAYQYDARSGYPTQVAAPSGDTIRYQYDGHLLTQTSWIGPVTGTVASTHNSDFWVTSQTVGGTPAIAYAYDADGLPTTVGALTFTRDGVTGQLTSTTIGNITTQNGFNTFGEPTQLTVTYSGQTIFAQSDVRDAAGRRTARTETVGGVTTTYGFGYDPVGHLANVTQAGTPYVSYVYDPNGNRTQEVSSGGTTVSTYDAQDRLMSSGSATYTFTPDGVLASQTNGAGLTQYRADALGNLLAITLPSGQQISYVVDGENRRVGRIVNGVQVQGFLYSGRRAIVAELDGANNVVSRFVWAESEVVPSYMIKGGVTYRLVSEPSGSVRLVVDVATGTIAQRLDYDPFGRVILDTKPGFQPFGFKGGLYDPATGLVHTRARDYDPNTGRWIAKDPTLFGGQNTNVYAYADGDPVNQVDPDGTFSLLEIGVQFGMNAVIAAANQSAYGFAVPAIKILHRLYVFYHSAEMQALEAQVVILDKFLDTWGRYDDASPDFEDHIAQAMTTYQQSYAAVATLAASVAKGMQNDMLGTLLPGFGTVYGLGQCLMALTGANPDNWVSFKDNPNLPTVFFNSCVLDQFYSWVGGKTASFFGQGVLGIALHQTILDGLQQWSEIPKASGP